MGPTSAATREHWASHQRPQNAAEDSVPHLPGPCESEMSGKCKYTRPQFVYIAIENYGLLLTTLDMSNSG